MKLFAAILLAFFYMILPVQAAVVSTVTVQGSSQVETLPDQAKINFGMVTTGKTAEEAQQENAVLATAVQARLLRMGLTEENLKTTQYAVYPIHSTVKDQQIPEITGYRVSYTLTATTDNLSQIGALIDNALNAGVNQILGVSFSNRDDTQLKAKALQNAVKDATAKAEAIASALDKKLGRIISVQENGLSIHLPEFTQRYMLQANGASTPIMPDSIRIDGTVNMIFEIK